MRLSVELTSTTDWRMAAGRNNVISITLRQVYEDFLNQILCFQSSSYPIVFNKPYNIPFLTFLRIHLLSC